MRVLHRISLVFLALFAILIASALFPINLRDPNWYIRVAAAIINSSTLPLLALISLAIATTVEPHNLKIKDRYQSFCKLAGYAAAGYLLLILLDIYAMNSLGGIASAQLRRLNAAETKLTSMRQAVRRATSAADLQSRFKSLQGPALDSQTQSIPLPQLKEQVNAAFDQASRQIEMDRAGLPAKTSLSRVPEMLNITLTCLAFSAGFYSFNQVNTTPDSSHTPAYLRRLKEIRSQLAAWWGKRSRKLKLAQLMKTRTRAIEKQKNKAAAELARRQQKLKQRQNGN